MKKKFKINETVVVDLKPEKKPDEKKEEKINRRVAQNRNIPGTVDEYEYNLLKKALAAEKVMTRNRIRQAKNFARQFTLKFFK